MTQTEFNQGWALLLLQPWAYRYKAINEFGELSSDAKEQARFYFDSVQAASGPEWLKICREYAKGKEWPSVDALRKSLSSVKQRSGVRVVDPAGGPQLDLDEFGRDLYDAIRLQSAQLQEEKNAAFYRARGLARFAAWSSENAEKLRAELTAIFQKDTLSPADLRRVLAIGSEPTNAS